MAKQVWRLQSGKITRPDGPGGAVETHKAPYDFIPTEGELSANKFRMVLIREIPDEGDAEKASDDTAPNANTSPVNICQMPVSVAINYINTVISPEELDALAMQECTNKPRIRSTVLAAIDTRRKTLVSPGSADTADAQIAMSERAPS